MKITVRIPSKKVPYGYLEYETEVDSVEPQALAEMYANLIRDYQAAEVAAFEAAPKKAVKLGPVEDSSVDEAVKLLNEGLGETTEVNESDPPAPWDKTSDETESTEEKPWDLDDSDWDM